MQNAEQELPWLVNNLLQSPAHKQRELIEKYFTPNCRLTHALVIAENREEIIRIFQYWRFINAHLSATVHEIAIESTGSVVFARITHHVHTRRSVWPLRRKFNWEATLRIKLVDAEAAETSGQLSPSPSIPVSSRGTMKQSSRKLIAAVESSMMMDSLLSPIPGLSWFYRQVGCRVAAWGTVLVTFLAPVIAKTSATIYDASFAVIGSDSASPEVFKRRVTAQRLEQQ